MKITKAVIATAGWSTRFLPAVKSYAKHLVPIWDKPQIQYVIEELVGAGITQICLVHRHGEKTLKQYFQYDQELEKYLKDTGKQSRLDSLHQIWQKVEKFKFIPQPRHLPYGNGSPNIAAKSFIGSDPFVYLWGDDLTIESKPGHFLSQMISTFIKYQPASVLAVQQVTPEEMTKLGSMIYADNPKYPNQIIGMVEKPPLGKQPSLMGQGGRFIVSPKYIKILQNQAISKGELWFTDASNTLAKTDIVLTEKYQDHQAFWTTTGDPLNWLKTNLLFVRQNPEIYPQIKEFFKNL